MEELNVIKLDKVTTSHEAPGAKPPDTRKRSTKEVVEPIPPRTLAAVQTAIDADDVAGMVVKLMHTFGAGEATYLIDGAKAAEEFGYSRFESGEKPHTVVAKLMRQGVYEVDPTAIVLHSVEDVSQDIDKCGYEVMRFLHGSIVTESNIATVTRSQGPYTVLQLAKYSVTMGLNTIFTTDAGTFVAKGNEGSEFKTCTLQDNQESPVGHWVASQLQIVSSLDAEPRLVQGAPESQYQLFATVNNRASYSAAEEQDVDFMMLTELNIHALWAGLQASPSSSEMPKLVRIGQSTYLTNNPKEGKNAVNRGQVHVRVPRKFEDVLEILNMEPKLALQADIFTEQYDVMPGEELMYDQIVRKEVIAKLYTIIRCLVSQDKSVATSRQERVMFSPVDGMTRLKNRTVCVAVDPGKVKTFDVVYFPHLTQTRPIVAQPKNGLITLTTTGKHIPPHQTIGTLKVSSGSALRAIIAAITSSMDQDRFKLICSQSTAIKAPGGWGKTTKLAEQYIPGSYCLTQTRMAQVVLAAKLVQVGKMQADQVHKYVLTLEKGGMTKLDSETVFIDEATMMTPTVVASALGTAVKKLMLYGDHMQIGVVHMDAMPGVRSTNNIMDVLEPKNVAQYWETRRFGEGLIDELKKIPALSKLTKHPDSTAETAVELKHSDNLQVQQIIDCAVEKRVDIIICHYNTTKTLITVELQRREIWIPVEMIEMGKTAAETVHKFQGNEANNVMVVQTPHSPNATSGIHLDMHYNISAATRCKNLLIWWSAGVFRHSTPLHVRLAGYQAGAGKETSVQEWAARLPYNVVSPAETRHMQPGVEELRQLLHAVFEIHGGQERRFVDEVMISSFVDTVSYATEWSNRTQNQDVKQWLNNDINVEMAIWKDKVWMDTRAEMDETRLHLEDLDLESLEHMYSTGSHLSAPQAHQDSPTTQHRTAQAPETATTGDLAPQLPESSETKISPELGKVLELTDLLMDAVETYREPDGTRVVLDVTKYFDPIPLINHDVSTYYQSAGKYYSQRQINLLIAMSSPKPTLLTSSNAARAAIGQTMAEVLPAEAVDNTAAFAYLQKESELIQRANNQAAGEAMFRKTEGNGKVVYEVVKEVGVGWLKTEISLYTATITLSPAGDLTLDDTLSAAGRALPEKITNALGQFGQGLIGHGRSESWWELPPEEKILRMSKMGALVPRGRRALNEPPTTPADRSKEHECCAPCAEGREVDCERVRVQPIHFVETFPGTLEHDCTGKHVPAGVRNPRYRYSYDVADALAGGDESKWQELRENDQIMAHTKVNLTKIGQALTYMERAIQYRDQAGQLHKHRQRADQIANDRVARENPLYENPRIVHIRHPAVSGPVVAGQTGAKTAQQLGWNNCGWTIRKWNQLFSYVCPHPPYTVDTCRHSTCRVHKPRGLIDMHRPSCRGIEQPIFYSENITTKQLRIAQTAHSDWPERIEEVMRAAADARADEEAATIKAIRQERQRAALLRMRRHIQWADGKLARRQDGGFDAFHGRNEFDDNIARIEAGGPPLDINGQPDRNWLESMKQEGLKRQLRVRIQEWESRTGMNIYGEDTTPDVDRPAGNLHQTCAEPQVQEGELSSPHGTQTGDSHPPEPVAKVKKGVFTRLMRRMGKRSKYGVISPMDQHPPPPRRDDNMQPPLRGGADPHAVEVATPRAVSEASGEDGGPHITSQEQIVDISNLTVEQVTDVSSSSHLPANIELDEPQLVSYPGLTREESMMVNLYGLHATSSPGLHMITDPRGVMTAVHTEEGTAMAPERSQQQQIHAREKQQSAAESEVTEPDVTDLFSGKPWSQPTTAEDGWAQVRNQPGHVCAGPDGKYFEVEQRDDETMEDLLESYDIRLKAYTTSEARRVILNAHCPADLAVWCNRLAAATCHLHEKLGEVPWDMVEEARTGKTARPAPIDDLVEIIHTGTHTTMFMRHPFIPDRAIIMGTLFCDSHSPLATSVEITTQGLLVYSGGWVDDLYTATRAALDKAERTMRDERSQARLKQQKEDKTTNEEQRAEYLQKMGFEILASYVRETNGQVDATRLDRAEQAASKKIAKSEGRQVKTARKQVKPMHTNEEISQHIKTDTQYFNGRTKVILEALRRAEDIPTNDRLTWYLNDLAEKTAQRMREDVEMIPAWWEEHAEYHSTTGPLRGGGLTYDDRGCMDSDEDSDTKQSGGEKEPIQTEMGLRDIPGYKLFTTIDHGLTLVGEITDAAEQAQVGLEDMVNQGTHDKRLGKGAHKNKVGSTQQPARKTDEELEEKVVGATGACGEALLVPLGLVALTGIVRVSDEDDRVDPEEYTETFDREPGQDQKCYSSQQFGTKRALINSPYTSRLGPQGRKRLRTLMHTTFMLAYCGNASRMIVGGSQVTVEVFNGCAACAGINFILDGRIILQISDDYWRLFNRAVYFEDVYEAYALMQYFGAGHLLDEGAQSSVTYFRVEHEAVDLNDNVLYHGILLDRLMHTLGTITVLNKIGLMANPYVKNKLMNAERTRKWSQVAAEMQVELGRKTHWRTFNQNDHSWSPYTLLFGKLRMLVHEDLPVVHVDPQSWAEMLCQYLAASDNIKTNVKASVRSPTLREQVFIYSTWKSGAGPENAEAVQRFLRRHELEVSMKTFMREIIDNMKLRSKLYKLPQLIRDTLGQTISDHIIFGGPLDSTLMGKGKHIEKNTKAYRYLQSIKAKIEIQKLKLPQPMLFLTSQQVKAYGDDLKALWPNMVLGQHTMGHTADTHYVMEQMHIMELVAYTNKMVFLEHADPRAITLGEIGSARGNVDTSALDAINRYDAAMRYLATRWASGHEMTEFSNAMPSGQSEGEASEAVVEMTKITTMKQVKMEEQLKTKTGPLFSPNGDMVANTQEAYSLGSALLTYPLESLAERLRTHGQVFGYYPSSWTEPESYVKTDGLYTHIAYAGGQTSLRALTETYECVTKLGYFEVGYQEALVKVLSIGPLVTTVRVTLCDRQMVTASTQVRLCDTRDHMKISIPVVDVSLGTGISTGKILKTWQAVVNKRLYRLVCIRMLRDSVDFEEVLRYAKVQLNTRYYTTRTIYNKYSLTSSLATDTAMAACISMSAEIKKYSLTSKMFEENIIVGQTHDLRTGLFNIGRTWSYEVRDMLVGLLGPLNKTLGLDMDLDQLVSRVCEHWSSNQDVANGLVQQFKNMKVHAINQPEQKLYFRDGTSLKTKSPYSLRPITQNLQFVRDTIGAAAKAAQTHALGKPMQYTKLALGAATALRATQAIIPPHLVDQTNIVLLVAFGTQGDTAAMGHAYAQMLEYGIKAHLVVPKIHAKEVKSLHPTFARTNIHVITGDPHLLGSMGHQIQTMRGTVAYLSSEERKRMNDLHLRTFKEVEKLVTAINPHMVICSPVDSGANQAASLQTKARIVHYCPWATQSITKYQIAGKLQAVDVDHHIKTLELARTQGSWPIGNVGNWHAELAMTSQLIAGTKYIPTRGEVPTTTPLQFHHERKIAVYVPEGRIQPASRFLTELRALIRKETLIVAYTSRPHAMLEQLNLEKYVVEHTMGHTVHRGILPAWHQHPKIDAADETVYVVLTSPNAMEENPSPGTRIIHHGSPNMVKYSYTHKLQQAAVANWSVDEVHKDITYSGEPLSDRAAWENWLTEEVLQPKPPKLRLEEMHLDTDYWVANLNQFLDVSMANRGPIWATDNVGYTQGGKKQIVNYVPGGFITRNSLYLQLATVRKLMETARAQALANSTTRQWYFCECSEDVRVHLHTIPRYARAQPANETLPGTPIGINLASYLDDAIVEEMTHQHGLVAHSRYAKRTNKCGVCNKFVYTTGPQCIECTLKSKGLEMQAEQHEEAGGTQYTDVSFNVEDLEDAELEGKLEQARKQREKDAEKGHKPKNGEPTHTRIVATQAAATRVAWAGGPSEQREPLQPAAGPTPAEGSGQRGSKAQGETERVRMAHTMVTAILSGLQSSRDLDRQLAYDQYEEETMMWKADVGPQLTERVSQIVALVKDPKTRAEGQREAKALREELLKSRVKPTTSLDELFKRPDDSSGGPAGGQQTGGPQADDQHKREHDGQGSSSGNSPEPRPRSTSGSEHQMKGEKEEEEEQEWDSEEEEDSTLDSDSEAETIIESGPDATPLVSKRGLIGDMEVEDPTLITAGGTNLRKLLAVSQSMKIRDPSCRTPGQYTLVHRPTKTTRMPGVDGRCVVETVMHHLKSWGFTTAEAKVQTKRISLGKFGVHAGRVVGDVLSMGYNVGLNRAGKTTWYITYPGVKTVWFAATNQGKSGHVDAMAPPPPNQFTKETKLALDIDVQVTTEPCGNKPNCLTIQNGWHTHNSHVPFSLAEMKTLVRKITDRSWREMTNTAEFATMLESIEARIEGKNLTHILSSESYVQSTLTWHDGMVQIRPVMSRPFRPGQILLVSTTKGWQISLVVFSDQAKGTVTAVCPAKPILDMVVDVRSNVFRRADAETPQDHMHSSQKSATFSCINAETREQLVALSIDLTGVPIGTHGKNWLVRYYDNEKHHRPEAPYNMVQEGKAPDAYKTMLVKLPDWVAKAKAFSEGPVEYDDGWKIKDDTDNVFLTKQWKIILGVKDLSQLTKLIELVYPKATWVHNRRHYGGQEAQLLGFKSGGLEEAGTIWSCLYSSTKEKFLKASRTQDKFLGGQYIGNCYHTQVYEGDPTKAKWEVPQPEEKTGWLWHVNNQHKWNVMIQQLIEVAATEETEAIHIKWFVIPMASRRVAKDNGAERRTLAKVPARKHLCGLRNAYDLLMEEMAAQLLEETPQVRDPVKVHVVLEDCDEIDIVDHQARCAVAYPLGNLWLVAIPSALVGGRKPTQHEAVDMRVEARNGINWFRGEAHFDGSSPTAAVTSSNKDHGIDFHKPELRTKRVPVALTALPMTGKTYAAHRRPDILLDFDDGFMGEEANTICTEMFFEGYDTINRDTTFIKEFAARFKKTRWYKENIQRPVIHLIWTDTWAHAMGMHVVGEFTREHRDIVKLNQLIKTIKEKWLPRIKKRKETDMSELQKLYPGLDAIEATQTWQIDDGFRYTTTPQGQDALVKNFMPYISNEDTNTVDLFMTAREDTPAPIMDMWTNGDLTDMNKRIAPSKDMNLSDHSEYTGFKPQYVTAMSEYPIHVRNTFTKAPNAVFNAVTTRLGTVITVRTENLDPKEEVDRVIDNMFVDDARNMIADYTSDSKLLSINADNTLEWLKTRPGNVGVAKEVDEIIAEGFTHHNLNVVKVHAKVESLLKYNPPGDFTFDRARIIVWQQKGICAIFAPVFLQAKERLKTLLKSNIIYADGLTPDDIAARVRLIDSRCDLLEDDLAKQDRQTDDQTLDCEFMMYAALGVHKTTLSMWRSIHRHWRLKGDTIRGSLTGMRHTGQATTALGNVIVNIFAHSRWYARNKASIELMIVLGDDFLAFTHHRTDLRRMRREIADYYNMHSTSLQSGVAGSFLQMLIYRNSTGSFECGPNIHRIYNKFQVTNGISLATEENFLARAMSYCMMLGDSPAVRKIIEHHDMPIEPINWYHRDQAIASGAAYHGLSLEQVEQEEQLLLEMLMNPVGKEYKFMTPTHLKW